MNTSNESDWGVRPAPQENLESPFLSETLFAGEAADEWEARLGALEAESPFLQGFMPKSIPVLDMQELEQVEWQDNLSEDERVVEEMFTNLWEHQSMPQTAVSTVRDLSLAIPPMNAATKLLTFGSLLQSGKVRGSIEWNRQRHPKESGIDPKNILEALSDYVNITLIKVAINLHNANNPTKALDVGNDLIDAIFVEAVHQFQMKCYCDPKQHDGKAGAGVLDSLGFWPRRGSLTTFKPNDKARDAVRNKQKEIAQAFAKLPNELSKNLIGREWWDSFINPSFLGWRFNRPIHIFLARKLRLAERWLLSQPNYIGQTPAQLGKTFNITEVHKGGRNEPDAPDAWPSIHTWGLGFDIKYLGNPHVSNKKNGDGVTFFNQIIHRAVTKVSQHKLPFTKFAQYLDSLAQTPGTSTGQIYDELKKRDNDLRIYLSSSSDQIKKEVETLKNGVFKPTSGERDPRNGFLNLDRDLVIALRDHACLAWGAVDIGGNESGDIMHFDCRIEPIGLAWKDGDGGGRPHANHPCKRGRVVNAETLDDDEFQDATPVFEQFSIFQWWRDQVNKLKRFVIENPDARLRDDEFREIRYKDGEILPPGKKIGDVKTIAPDKIVVIDDFKTNKNGIVHALVRIATNNGISEPIGWTSSINFQGKLYNEIIDFKPAAYLVRPDERPDYYTVGSHNAAIRNGDTPEYKVDKKKGILRQGDFVAVVAASKDSTPIGEYVKVMSLKKVDEKTFDLDKDLGWTAKSNLVPGLADFKGDNAAWSDANYVGQVDLFAIVALNGKQEHITRDLYPKYIQMVEAAKTEGIEIILNDGFRKYFDQVDLRNKFDREAGNGACKPGCSNHQNGIALDLHVKHDPPPNKGIGAGDEYIWLSTNATQYGFVRLVENEAWHWEYHPELAKQFREQGIYSQWIKCPCGSKPPCCKKKNSRKSTVQVANQELDIGFGSEIEFEDDEFEDDSLISEELEDIDDEQSWENEQEEYEVENDEGD